MKRFIVLLCASILIFSAAKSMENEEIYKNSNSDFCRKIEEKIFLKDNIETAAVVEMDKNVLCGILCTDTELPEGDILILKKYIYDAVCDEIKNLKKVKIEINSKTAKNIAELSYYAGMEMKKRAVCGRFNYLMEN